MKRMRRVHRFVGDLVFAKRLRANTDLDPGASVETDRGTIYVSISIETL